MALTLLHSEGYRQEATEAMKEIAEVVIALEKKLNPSALQRVAKSKFAEDAMLGVFLAGLVFVIFYGTSHTL